MSRRIVRYLYPVASAMGLFVLAVSGPSDVLAQASPSTSHGPRPIPYPVVPPADFQRALAGGTRSPSGAPGTGYWQQWAHYDLHARLDPIAKRLDGRARIVYRNNSPDTLPVFFLHLLQNLHAAGAARNEPQQVTGGVELHRVAVDGRALSERRDKEPGYRVQGTILDVHPPRPLEPGGAVELAVDWSFTVPQSGAGRMGWSRDNFFFIAYWYPQVAVYDDVVGWQLDQYLGQAEFYSGFGTYRLTVEAPEGWVVMGTGALENREAVLPDPILRRLRQAEESDTVVHVLTNDDFGPGKATRRSATGYLRWQFGADTVRDVAFSATRESLWDAARTPVGDRDDDGHTDYARIDALYRETAPRWQQTWRYAQHAIDFLSRWTGYPYPWPHMTAVEGGGIIGGGMEFPMMTLIGDYNARRDSGLYYVTAHELAHMWIPMIVGADEKRHAWMDEGSTSFNENQARKEFFPGRDHDDPDRQTYLTVARQGLEGELIRRSDYHYPGPAYGIASYSKPATLLVALRGLLGDETFVRTYRTYIRNWAFKHPRPWDFFNTFNEGAGETLDWFWRTWYYETWTLDHAVASVTTQRAASRGPVETTIAIEDRGMAPMPTRVTITLESGESIDREIPVSHWLTGARRAEITIAGTPQRVEIDPEGVFPDVDRTNNLWERQ